MKASEKLLFYLLLLSVAAAYFSITLFEAFLVLAIPLGFYLLWKRGENPFKGLFSIPLTGHLSAITISSFLFLRVKEQWRRLLEQDFFSLTYFVGFAFSKENAERFLRYSIYISVFAGLILSVKVIYSHFFLNDYKGFWGGNFVVGNLLALSFFGSFYLFLNSKGWIRYLFPILALIFLFVAFLPVERSVILGYLIGFSIFLYGIFKKFEIKKFWLLIFAAVFLLAGSVALLKNPKISYWLNLIKNQGVKVETVNSLSSNRLVIAKGALELVEDAIKKGDYLKLLVGWGYGPQKQYRNLPKGLNFINEYESFVFLTEFINGGILNLIFILWFYLSALILTYKVLKVEDKKIFLLVLTGISALWVNLGYHLFTLFWVPINALFYTIAILVERIIKAK